MPAPVLTSLSQRVLPVLQLTRMALVFTAIADSMCGLLLRAAQRRTLFHTRLIEQIDKYQLIAVVIISVGLYGYGMSLNDIIDRRRDQQLAAHRPLPSGRVSRWFASWLGGSLLGLGEPLGLGGWGPVRSVDGSGLGAGAAVAGCDNVIGPDSSSVKRHEPHIAVQGHSRGEILNPGIVKVLLSAY